ncbi:hypothetical protein HZA97_09305, partial [Candidatus Woesearchaeota archaeon]|nr:hypothetical protein [Candidatus Woesearchaeota archaeon]
MQAHFFLRELAKLNRSVLSFNDAVKIIGKKRAYARLYLHRLKKRELLNEIEKGKYALSDDPYEIGSNLLFPSYVSFLSAYFIYGFTTQIPISAQIICCKPKKSF